MQNSQKEVISYNSKMVGSHVRVVKDGGWNGKVEKVIDEEYFKSLKLKTLFKQT